VLEALPRAQQERAQRRKVAADNSATTNARSGSGQASTCDLSHTNAGSNPIQIFAGQTVTGCDTSERFNFDERRSAADRRRIGKARI
jgi:hypothetical protein